MGSGRKLARLILAATAVAWLVSGSGAAAGQTPRLRVGGDIQAPKKIRTVAPVYPEDAKAAGVQGVVMLEAVIGTNGSVIEIEVRRSVPMLDDAAIEAVRQWEYTPTLLNGEPVELLMTVTINFTLQ
jgi:periplasmic protein TonB